MRGVVVVIAVALSACTQPSPQDESAEIAKDLCACFEPGSATCVAGAEQQFGATGPSQACIDCVFADQHACAAMVQECVGICVQVATPGGI